MADSLIITPFESKPSSTMLMTDGYFGGTANGIDYRLGYNSSISVPVYIGAVLDTSTGKYSSAFIGFTANNIVIYYNEAYNSSTDVTSFTMNTPWSISGNSYKFGMLYNIPPDFPSYIPKFGSRNAMAEYFLNYSPEILYPITYSYSNSTVSGPAEAAVGDTVVVSAIPNNNYGITDPESQILVTNNDISVPYQWNPSTNTITFTMPDPS